MPKANRKPCNYMSCRILTYGRYCPNHKVAKTAKAGTRSKEGHERQKMYDRRWRVVRKIHLNSSPLCVECERKGRVELATVVDHIIPHRGSRELFDDTSNYQSLCKRHHDQKTARGE